MHEPIRIVLDWLSVHWLTLFLLVALIAVFDGFFQKTRYYLGDKVKVKTSTEVFLQDNETEKYLSIRIVNEENIGFVRCHAVPLRLQKKFWNYDDNKKRSNEIIRTINPNSANLSWALGSEDGFASIPANEGERVLNIAKIKDRKLIFLFHGWEYPTEADHEYHMSIKIEGYTDENPQKPITAILCDVHFCVNNFLMLPKFDIQGEEVDVNRGIEFEIIKSRSDMKTKSKSPKKEKRPSKKGRTLTKTDFLKALDKVILTVKKKPKSSSKEKSGTSE